MPRTRSFRRRPVFAGLILAILCAAQPLASPAAAGELDELRSQIEAQSALIRQQAAQLEKQQKALEQLSERLREIEASEIASPESAERPASARVTPADSSPAAIAAPDEAAVGKETEGEEVATGPLPETVREGQPYDVDSYRIDAPEVASQAERRGVRLSVGDGLSLDLVPWGYVRVGYQYVEEDEEFSFIGRNNGFVLDNARIGLDGAFGSQLSFRISVEAASDLTEDTNNPIGEIDVRLRDGFLRWDPFSWVGAQAGQFKAPFAGEELMSTPDLLFIDRAVELQGVIPGQGFEVPGLSLDRQLGAMLSPRTPLSLGLFGVDEPALREIAFRYYAMLANGNGENQFLNDNDDLAFIGRLELLYGDLLQLGGAFFVNNRTIGDPPNRFREDDTGYAADMWITPGNLELYFQFVGVDTEFSTVGLPDVTRNGWHAQIGYTFDTPWVYLTPAYRFARYDPRASGADSANGLPGEAFRLDYQTAGLRVEHVKLPIAFYFNYTFTDEYEPRELHNDIIQVLAQVVF